jgi:uncharacterized protein YqjF (DUF2071 family)
MKALKVLNTIAIGIPITIAMLGFIDEMFIIYALFSTTATGAIQVVTGILFWIKFPTNTFIKIYFGLVVLFFISLFISFYTNWIWFLPALLTVYLSVLIYSTSTNKTSFMHAEWNDLLFINYEINPQILEKYVPKGTELDLWNGKCYLSLIGFMFENVKVLGIKIPFHVNFEEVNLRFYVKRFDEGVWKRGVVFVKEIVPKHAITIVANTLYNEQYQTLPMRHERTAGADSWLFKYEWKKNNIWNTITVKTDKELKPIDKHSEAEFISEHYYGYTISARKKTVEYEVTHPKWNQYQVIDYAVNVHFEMVYGKEFAFLQGLKPASCFVAKGSKITIESKKIL